MKKKEEMWSSTTWHYALTIDIVEEGKKGVVDVGGPTRIVLMQAFH